MCWWAVEDLFSKMVSIIPPDTCKPLLPSSAPICLYSLTYITNIYKNREARVISGSWDLCCSGVLRSIDWYFITHISVKPISPIFKGQAVQEECWAPKCSQHSSHFKCAKHSSWTAWPLKMGLIGCPKMLTNIQSTLHKIPEECKTQQQSKF